MYRDKWISGIVLSEGSTQSELSDLDIIMISAVRRTQDKIEQIRAIDLHTVLQDALQRVTLKQAQEWLEKQTNLPAYTRQRLPQIVATYQ